MLHSDHFAHATLPDPFFIFLFFFFNDTATTEIYTLSLHDALPISRGDARPVVPLAPARSRRARRRAHLRGRDRKSTRLNSSHVEISYAVFCLKKKKKQRKPQLDTCTLIAHTDNRMP